VTSDQPGGPELPDTHREIGRRQLPEGEVRTVLIRRHYHAPVADVWDACTVPDRLNRWFLQVSGDLRVGGKYSLEGNAGGEILRCEPPRLLTVTWVYGERPASQVELRPAPADGGTVLELEHALPDPTVELDGRLVSAFRNDPETGIWGVPTGWEMPLVYGLERYLRGELPDAPAAEWFEFTAEVVAQADRIGQAWAEIVAAAGLDRPAG